LRLLKVGQGIHPLVQDADDVDPSLADQVEDHAGPLRVAVVAVLDVGAGFAKVGMLGPPGETPVEAEQIGIALSASPGS
jgi:hypothetical protein